MRPVGAVSNEHYMALLGGASFISEFVDGGADDNQSADGEGPGEVRERPVFMSRVTRVCVGR